MQRNHPPLPTESRSTYRVLRVIGTVLGVASLVLAVVCAVNGWWIGASVSLGIGTCFAALTWLPPTSKWVVPIMTVLVVGISLYLRNWWISAILFGILAWSAWARRRVPTLPTEFTPIGADEVMKNASEFVAGFKSIGYEQVAAYRANIGLVDVIVSLLLAPEATSYASATDTTLNVTSIFAGGRRLHTRNHSAMGLPDNVLINPVPGGRPEGLVSSHLAALDLLAEQGHVPVKLSPADLAGIAIATELEAIQWLESRKRVPQPSDRTELSKRSDFRERLHEWNEVPT